MSSVSELRSPLARFTTAMFDRYNTVDSEDARVAMNRYEGFLRNQTTASPSGSNKKGLAVFG
jgi:hypothetical protein